MVSLDQYSIIPHGQTKSQTCECYYIHFHSRPLKSCDPESWLSTPSKLIPCPNPGQRFSIMDLKSILNPTESLDICDICGKSFNKRCTLLRHKRNVHALHTPCGFCKKGLKLNSRPYAYKTHLLRCHAFLTTYANLNMNEKVVKAEYHSLKLRQRPKRDFKEELLQENSPVDDKNFIFPLPSNRSALAAVSRTSRFILPQQQKPKTTLYPNALQAKSNTDKIPALRMPMLLSKPIYRSKPANLVISVNL